MKNLKKSILLSALSIGMVWTSKASAMDDKPLHTKAIDKSEISSDANNWDKLFESTMSQLAKSPSGSVVSFDDNMIKTFQFKPALGAPDNTDQKSNSAIRMGDGGRNRRMVEQLLNRPKMSPDEEKQRNDDFKNTVANAVLQHPELLSRIQQTGQVEQSVDVVKGGLYPQVDLTLSGASALSKPNIKYQSSNDDRLDLVLRVRQILFDFGALFGQIDAQKFRVLAAEQETKTTGDTLILRAVTAYQDVIRLRNHVAIAQENVAQHKNIVQAVIERVTGGVASLSDKAKVESTLANAEVRLASFMSDLGRVEASFIELFDKKPDSNLLFPTIHPEMPPVEQALNQAVANNSVLHGFAQMSQVYDAEKKVASLNILPKVYLELSGTRYDVENFTADRANGVSVRLISSYNLYSGGSDMARISQAERRSAQAQEDFDKYKRDLERNVRVLISDYEARVIKLKSQEMSLRANDLVVQAFAEQYDAGRRSLIDLLDAQSDLFASAIDLSESQFQLNVLRYELCSVIGDLANFFAIPVNAYQPK
ncbi:MAG: TolC family protein [Magnetococcus sp. DMHC-6]